MGSNEFNSHVRGWPVDVHKNKGFAVVANDESMVPAGIEPRMVLYCDPTLTARDGDIVYIEDDDRRATIKKFKGYSEIEGKKVVLIQSWRTKENDCQQQEFSQTLPESKINRMAVVSYIKRRP